MMIPSPHCQDNTSLAVKYSTYWESVKGNGVSPWDGSPFDSVCKHRLNEKLEMRNAKWWCGAFRHPERRKTSYVKKWLI